VPVTGTGDRTFYQHPTGDRNPHAADNGTMHLDHPRASTGVISAVNAGGSL